MFSKTDKSGVLDGLLERVGDRVPNYFPELQRVGQLRITHSIRRAYSSIHRVAVDVDGRLCKQLIVKISETVATEFVAMKALWPEFNAHATWKIPRPLDYLPQDSALVMEEFTGVPLLQRLPRIVWHDRACEMAAADCRRVGQWLRFYHDIGRATKLAPLNLEGKYPGLDETLDHLFKAGFTKRLLPLMEKWFVPLIKRAVTLPRPVSNVHGDFTADNVMLNNEFVVVLDLSAEFRNAIDLDIASFLNSILMLRLTRAVPSAALEGMREAFLSGYFGTEQCAPIVACFLQGIGLADIALGIVQRRQSPLVREWVERVVSGGLEKVIVELRRLS